MLILPALLLTLLAGTPAFSADFQKGLTAAQSGDFATALREWTPLAKQGNAVAQYNMGLLHGNGWGVGGVLLNTLCISYGHIHGQGRVLLRFEQGSFSSQRGLATYPHSSSQMMKRCFPTYGHRPNPV